MEMWPRLSFVFNLTADSIEEELGEKAEDLKFLKEPLIEPFERAVKDLSPMLLFCTALFNILKKFQVIHTA